MKRSLFAAACAVAALLTVPESSIGQEQSDRYRETIDLFRGAGESAGFFDSCYGFAVFPTIGKAGLGIGGAHGTGRVYVDDEPVAETKMTQLSFGWQAGAQGYSLMIFFQDKRALDEFASGSFEFGAKVSAVAITAGASAGAGTGGTSAGASGGKKDATTVGAYQKGMAPFVIIKGGLMYEAALAGAKFSYKPLGKD